MTDELKTRLINGVGVVWSVDCCCCYQPVASNLSHSVHIWAAYVHKFGECLNKLLYILITYNSP